MENLIKITKDKTMLTVIRTNGEITELKPKGRRVSLEELQAAVGGYIEMVTLKNKIIICNEEGKLMNLPLNEKVTQMFQLSCGTHDVIVGDAILADLEDID